MTKQLSERVHAHTRAHTHTDVINNHLWEVVKNATLFFSPILSLKNS